MLQFSCYNVAVIFQVYVSVGGEGGWSLQVDTATTSSKVPPAVHCQVCCCQSNTQLFLIWCQL